jgi:glutamate dehydrogenase (NAD(P)+)
MRRLYNITIEGENYLGYVAIDSIINDTSSGGVRISEDLNLAEVKALAKEMTLKYSFIGLQRGGAKSGIKMPAGVSIEEKRRILEDFGKRVSSIIKAGIYHPGMDMNCGPDDLRAIYKGAGYEIGSVTDTSFFTAISVSNAIYACKESFGFKRVPLTVAIQGFGSVGGCLASRLPEDQFKIVSVSTIKGGILNEEGLPLRTLIESWRKYGDDFVNKMGGKGIEKERVLTADVDILIPSARTWVINENNVYDIKARFIIPIANAPYTENALEILHDKGIICLPGFVTNSGGVYASSLFDSGVPVKEIEDLSTIFYRDVIKRLLKKSIEERISPVKVSEEIARKRFNSTAMNSDDKRFEKLLRSGYRKGMIPKKIYGMFVLNRFIANLKKLVDEIDKGRSSEC